MEGKTILGYTLQYRLGIGGMAEVWYAENKIHKRAAVKILNRDLSLNENIVARFQNEAEIMVALNHPNIRQVYDYSEIDGRPAIIMEYLEGDDLKARMKQGQRFTNDELVKWWNQLVDALKYTHEEGIVHRDIKPGNIFVDKKGNVKLLDFGIAKVRESISSTQTGQKLGTLMYMSPEQVRDSKHLDYHTDIYSLAVTFVHLLTGKKPYDSDSVSDYDIQTAIVTKPLDLSDVPAEWKGSLAPYLEKDPSKRPELRHFEAVKYDDKDEETIIENTVVKPVRTEVPKASKDTKASKATKTPNKKSKLGLWIVLVIAAVAVGIAVFVFSSSSATKEAESTEANAFTNKTFTVNGVSFEMIAVKGGTFTMGSTDQYASSNETPTHNVTLSDYYIGKLEVTQTLWKAVMGTDPSYFKGDDLPVEQVSWNDCQEFIKKLNQMTGQNFRLPTEAEWEYAARGGTNTSLYNGENINIKGKYNSPNLDKLAWYGGNCGQNYTASAGCDVSNGYDISGWREKQYNDSKGGTHPVGLKQPNAYGLYDMLGNVWEWCQDWYGDYSSGSQTNPTGPSSGSFRVLRGGNWVSSARDCRVSDRDGNYPDNGFSLNGFRLVLVP